MLWLAVAIAVVPSTAATARALATSHTFTRVRILRSVWRASSRVARPAVEVMRRSCREVPTPVHVGPDALAELGAQGPRLGVQLGPQPPDAPLRVAEPDQVGRPRLDDGV